MPRTEGQRLEAPGRWGPFRGLGETHPSLPTSPLASAPGSSLTNFPSALCCTTMIPSLFFLWPQFPHLQNGGEHEDPLSFLPVLLHFASSPSFFRKGNRDWRGSCTMTRGSVGTQWCQRFACLGPRGVSTMCFTCRARPPAWGSGGKGGLGDEVARKSSDSLNL